MAAFTAAEKAEELLAVVAPRTKEQIQNAKDLAEQLMERVAQEEAAADLAKTKKDAIAYLNNTYLPAVEEALPGVKAEGLSDVVNTVVAAINGMDDVDAIKAYVNNTAPSYGEGIQAIWAAAQQLAEDLAATVEVSSEEELTTALAGDKTIIQLTKDVDLTAQLVVPAGKTLDGNGNKITAKGYKGSTASENGGLLVNGGTVKNLTVVGPDTNIGWDNGEYGIKAYGEATLENIAVNGANAGIQIAANTTLKGTIDVSGNEFGNIEVKDNAVLTIDEGATLVNTTESAAALTIWKDTEAAGTVKGGSLTSKLLDGGKQYYFLNAANAQ